MLKEYYIGIGSSDRAVIFKVKVSNEMVLGYFTDFIATVSMSPISYGRIH